MGVNTRSQSNEPISRRNSISKTLLSMLSLNFFPQSARRIGERKVCFLDDCDLGGLKISFRNAVEKLMSYEIGGTAGEN
jgi:hypothetical protein